ncbi:MAG: DNA polymerase III subunit epsilon [Pseudorhodoplanes sp.]|uniref:DNA polymerase III subunit epsilon n=1 Tax=Pseudorhodoplanes sp. TaxID=1934341 RepID=UPI003D108A2E
MREIVFDTETTGLDPVQGHRLVEIGCIELFNRFPTGRTFHKYVNPERDMPVEAFNVHGLSVEFLRQHRVFHEIADEFLEFVADAPLVAHNGYFDLAFINSELDLARRPPFARDRIVDTLMLARRKHPGVSNKLDDLCVRYKIDNSRRTKHGALLDAELLAEVYIELTDARQTSLGLVASSTRTIFVGSNGARSRTRPVPLPARISEDERLAHAAFIATLGENAVWRSYSGSI